MGARLTSWLRSIVMTVVTSKSKVQVKRSERVSSKESSEALTKAQTQDVDLRRQAAIEKLESLIETFRCVKQQRDPMPMCVEYNEGVLEVCRTEQPKKRLYTWPAIVDTMVISQLHVARTVHSNGHLMMEMEED